ncbi:hypothetical protein POVCU2_0091240 [Plasmodium ovale curtisi]|uniref:PIR Superfamily Protein n=1 Tax=Plasmodium ovale curtisi TaxID=864141 RepID=A0A1A8WSP6_PLAOA|nr:hypothetical protein POVCU2_0091240 [Plasmodium ovale curtisi]
MQTERLNIDKLPSNKYKDALLKRTDFTKLEKEGTFDENPSENYQMLNNFNRDLMLGYHDIKRTCSPGGDPKCCRDVNYFLDLLTIFIKKSKINEGEKNDLIKHVEDYWKDKLLYDYGNDKNVTEKKELQYNEYLNRKLDSIINYTNSNNKYLYYNIKYNNNNERINFRDFLLNTRDFSFINCQALEKYDITFSDEKTFDELENASQVPYTIVHPFVGAKPGRETMAGTGEPPHREGGAREVDWSEEAVGAQAETSFFHKMDKFSPVKPWINTLLRKTPEVGKSMYKDESLLFLNHPQYKDHYISYNSI